MIDFPNSPAVGTEHPVGDKVWVYTGVAWKLKGSGSGNLRSLAELTPTDADIIEYDGTNGEWVAKKNPRELYLDGGNF